MKKSLIVICFIFAVLGAFALGVRAERYKNAGVYYGYGYQDGGCFVLKRIAAKVDPTLDLGVCNDK